MSINPLTGLVIRQHREHVNDYRNAARYGRYLYRREQYLRGLADGVKRTFPLELVRA